MVEYLAMLIDEVSKQLKLFSWFLHFLENFGKMSRDVREKVHGGCNFENNLHETKILNFKKHSPIVLSTSKTLYCHQDSADFTYFVPLDR